MNMMNDYGFNSQVGFDSANGNVNSNGYGEYVVDLTKLPCFKPISKWGNRKIEKYGDLFADNYALIIFRETTNDNDETEYETIIFGGDKPYSPEEDYTVLNDFINQGYGLYVYHITGANPHVEISYDEEQGITHVKYHDFETYKPKLPIPYGFFQIATNTFNLFHDDDSNNFDVGLNSIKIPFGNDVSIDYYTLYYDKNGYLGFYS